MNAVTVLQSLLTTVREHVPGTIAGADPEHLHQLRVAIRRTRSILRELDELLPPAAVAAGRDLFAHLADATGAARDLDVHVLGWDQQVADLATGERDALRRVRSELERRRADAHAELRLVLGSAEISTGLAAWAGRLDEAVTTDGDTEALAAVVRGRVAKLHERLVRDGRRIDAGSPAADLHELRKDGKRLRYLVDCFSQLFDKAPRKAYLAQLRALQDNLGAHQDAAVQIDYLRGIARHLNDGTPAATEVLLALGRLSARLDGERQAARAAFDKRFGSFDSPRTEQLLAALLASAAVTPDP